MILQCWWRQWGYINQQVQRTATIAGHTMISHTRQWKQREFKIIFSLRGTLHCNCSHSWRTCNLSSYTASFCALSLLPDITAQKKRKINFLCKCAAVPGLTTTTVKVSSQDRSPVPISICNTIETWQTLPFLPFIYPAYHELAILIPFSFTDTINFNLKQILF